MSRSVAIVGNGPIEAGSREVIDASDIVIRFNEPTHPADVAGTRTDILFIANSGKTMQQRLEGRSFRSCPAFVAARKVVLPYHPEILARYHQRPSLLSRLKGRKLDWTQETVELSRAFGKEVDIVSPQLYECCCNSLEICTAQKRSFFPSSGILALMYVLTELRLQPAHVRLCGFGWAGWKRHLWSQERALAHHLLQNAFD